MSECWGFDTSTWGNVNQELLINSRIYSNFIIDYGKCLEPATKKILLCFVCDKFVCSLLLSFACWCRTFYSDAYVRQYYLRSPMMFDNSDIGEGNVEGWFCFYRIVLVLGWECGAYAIQSKWKVLTFKFWGHVTSFGMRMRCLNLMFI